ncbi:MAG: GNAT family N-acetyltransferase [Bacteroidales bacterium]|nr:GNAT family N-acetyltransferase [Bacteroidales bacterium]
MQLLERNSYFKLIAPLKKVTFNNLFARSVIEHCVSGKIYVDDNKKPETFYVIHPYGMSLLFGNWNNKDFNDSFRDYALNLNKTRERHEWMQAFPHDWNAVLNELFKDCIIKSSDNIENKEYGMIELNTRINFQFNKDKYLKNRKNKTSTDYTIFQTDKQVFGEMKGTVVPSHFWDSADDFCKNGVGFSLFYGNKLISTAYSAYIHDHKLELGIETVEEFRGKGFAQSACRALIDFCIENDYEPIWSCRIENTGSYNLALKLGFEPCKEIPYYRLSK